MGFDLKEGTLFAGRYQIVRSLGEGAMGAVYEVVHLETERRRALKVMHADLYHEGDHGERFRREARVGARVQSEFIVDVFDAGVDAATWLPYLVMELLRGEDLDRRLQRLGRLPAAEVVTYLHQVALALDKTHAASIVHRDLKPENLFLTEREDGQPRIKVLDFGIAKLIAEGPGAARATRNIGTPLYMAPEQLTGDPVSGATDLYALAMVAYTLLVGTPYWTSEARTNNLMSMLLIVGRGPSQPACSRAAAHGVALPPSFDAWFAKSAAISPGDRWTRATEMVHALAIALGLPAPGAITVTPPAGPPDSDALGARAPGARALGVAGGSTSAFTTASPASTAAPAPRSRKGGIAAILVALGVGGLLGASAYAVHLGRAPPAEPAPVPAPATVDAPPAPPPAPPPVPAEPGADATTQPAAGGAAPLASATAAPAASSSAGHPAAEGAASAGPRSTSTPSPIRRRYTRD